MILWYISPPTFGSEPAAYISIYISLNLSMFLSMSIYLSLWLYVSILSYGIWPPTSGLVTTAFSLTLPHSLSKSTIRPVFERNVLTSSSWLSSGPEGTGAAGRFEKRSFTMRSLACEWVG